MVSAGIKNQIETQGYTAALGVRVEDLNEESASLFLPYKDENSNPGGALHGGVAASLINLGGLSVARATLGEEAEPIHTASIQVNYLAAAISEPIRAKAQLLRRGKELCYIDVGVETEAGKPIARGLTTVRGRFGAEPSPTVQTIGDSGAADPGPMGKMVPGTVAFIKRLGLDFQNMSGGESRIVMPFQDRNGNGQGGVHEGPILALLDTAGAMAAWAVTGPGAFKASTVGIQAQFVGPTREEELVGYGRVTQQDREIFWSNVEVASSVDGRVVARATVLYRIVTPDLKR